MCDISVILTGHREGILAGTTARSACIAIKNAQQIGLSLEVLVVLDSATPETRSVLEHGLSQLGDETPVRFMDVKTGDPGQSRNLGIAEAKGTCSTFLDGDDLWSSNWLVEAWKVTEARPDVVVQSMCNVTFGQEKNIWWHVDSEGAFFDPRYLSWGNYWDAMSFARTNIYRDIPFKGNNLKLGFGHEDWHWSVVTYNNGIHHKPAPETIHFKRRRAGSQMSLVDKAGAVVWYE